LRSSGVHAVLTAFAVTRDTLRLNPLRSALSTLGVIIGVAALVAVLSLGDGMERTARERIAQTTDLQSMSVESRRDEEIDGQSFPLADTARLGRSELAAVLQVPGVAGASLVARAGIEVRSADTSVRRMAGLTSFTPAAAALPLPALAAGRFIAAGDTAAAPRVAVVSAQLGRDLAPGGGDAALGDTILVNGWPLTVVGVLAGELPPVSRSVLVPYAPGLDTLLAVRALRYPSLLVRAARIEDVATVERALKDHFAARNGSSPRFAVLTYRARAEQASQGILVFKLLMAAITGISLIVGGIGIMNVLLASVTERTREIGIRKASGARHRDILLQFLAESVAITGFGSLLGVVLGLAGAFAVTALIRHFADAVFVQASFSWSSVIAAAILSVAIGLGFGTYPARRAARLSPIDAIRHE
jgi:putative ABC transport system permease protein